jgi:hypothetical protein
MSGFFEAVKNLLPRARAFQLFIDNNKRRFFEALSELPEDVKREAERVYTDTFPDTTRFPDIWEKTFALYLTEAEYSKRRNILDALWKTISGNQAIDFLQSVLRSFDRNFFVAENIPLTDPRNKNSAGIAVCDYKTMCCDNDFAVCDYLMGDADFTPSILQNDVSEIYTIPDDTRFWETCFFVCKSVYRNEVYEILFIEPMEINIVWKNIIEYLVLKIKPVHTTAVMFVKWTE